MGGKMKVGEAAARMLSVAEDCARAFEEMGLRTECEVCYYDAKFNTTDPECAKHVNAALTIYAGDGEDAARLAIEMSAEVRGGEVSEDELYSAFASFDSSCEETLGDIHRTGDPEEAIRAMSAAVSVEYEALLKKLRFAQIGVGILAAVAVIVVILTVIF